MEIKADKSRYITDYLNKCQPIYSPIIKDNKIIGCYLAMTKFGNLSAILYSGKPIDGNYDFKLKALNSPQVKFNWCKVRSMLNQIKHRDYNFYRDIRYNTMILGSENVYLFKSKRR